MGAQSKVFNSFTYDQYLTKLLLNNVKKVAGVGAVAIVLYIIKQITAKKSPSRSRGANNDNSTNTAKSRPKSNKGSVDKEFFRRLRILVKVVIPSWTSPVVWDMSLTACLFVIRTFLSIYIATINGKIVKSIVNYNKASFITNIGNLALLALPASFVNSQ